MENLLVLVFIMTAVYFGLNPQTEVVPDFDTLLGFFDNLLLGPFRVIGKLREGIFPFFDAFFDWLQTLLPGLELEFIDKILDSIERFTTS